MPTTELGASWDVYGHEWAVVHLQSAIAHDRIRHGYLILGAEGIGKETLARQFAMTLNCTNPEHAARPCHACSSCRRIVSGTLPDMLYANPDPTTGALKIEEIRRVGGLLSLKPFEARYRIAIFRDFDHAQPRAQDALLKTLEEPPPHAMLMLLASSAENVLPTITSRSQTIHLRPLSALTVYEVLTQKYHVEDGRAQLLAQISGGRLGWALRALEDETVLDARAESLDRLEAILTADRVRRFLLAEELAKDKAGLIDQLQLWQTYWRDVLLMAENTQLPVANIDRAESMERLAVRFVPEEILKALKATRTLERLLTTTNAGHRLALEAALLDYPLFD